MGFPIRNEGVDESSQHVESSKVYLAILLTSIHLFLNPELLILRGKKISMMTQKFVKADRDIRIFVKRGTACLLRNSWKREENVDFF